MLKAFQVITPGKIILHGEHAVVYNKPALAATCGLMTKLNFTPQSDSRSASLELENLNCVLEIHLDQLEAFVAMLNKKYSNEQLITITTTTTKTLLLDECRIVVTGLLEAMSVATLPKQQHIHKAFLAIYYLLTGALISTTTTKSPTTAHFKRLSGFKIHVESELSIGSGLGSSASFGATVAAAVLLYAGHFNATNYLEAKHQALISQWAFESERVMHGTPSGVDNTVCTYGGMLRFVKGQPFQRLNIQRPLHILLVDSRVNRSTADVVANVGHLHATFPKVIGALWQACEELVVEAIPLYESFGNGQDDSEKFEKLERLFQINNDLMKAIGVTHPKLEEIFTIAFKRGFFSKLTGAGAGGFAIVLLPEKYEGNQVYWKLREELEASGFAVHVTTAGGNGLRITQESL